MHEGKCKSAENTTVVDQRSTGLLVCPRDRAALNKVSLHGGVVDACPICNGLLIQLDQSKIPGLSSSAVEFATNTPGLDRGRRGAISPLTKDPMLVFDYKGVEIDCCPGSNSVWLDAQELQKIRGRKNQRPIGKCRFMGNTRDTSSCSFDSSIGTTVYEVFEFIAEAISELFDGL